MTWEMFLVLAAIGIGIVCALSLYGTRKRGFDRELPPDRYGQPDPYEARERLQRQVWPS